MQSSLRAIGKGYLPKAISLSGFSCFLFISCSLVAAPTARNRYYDDENGVAIREMRDSLDSLRHEVNNHESEIRVFDEKLNNLDAIIENVREHLNDSNKSYKESLKGNFGSLETKINALEAANKALMGDWKQFKTYANETTAALNQYKLRMDELEKIVEQQNQNLSHLEQALRSLMEALQVKETKVEKGPSTPSPKALEGKGTSNKTYRIKSGDSLEKIARSHQVSIESLKEYNNLTSDRILEGKVLRIPEK